MNSNLHITCSNGTIYTFYINKNQLVPLLNATCKYLMGLTKLDDVLYISSSNAIFNNEKGIKLRGGHFLHHMKAIKNKIYTTSTGTNSILRFNKDLKFEKQCIISPPIQDKKIKYGVNYNHVNSIFFYKDLFYVGLNWFTDKRFGSSGYAVLDSDMNEIERKEYGWQSHGFCIIDDVKYALCGFNKYSKKVNHIEKSGLFVDGELVFEYIGNWFCKDFSVDKDNIYIVGGKNVDRKFRGKTDGVIFVLDREFNLVERYVFEGLGEFKGCLLNKYDLTEVGDGK